MYIPSLNGLVVLDPAIAIQQIVAVAPGLAGINKPFRCVWFAGLAWV